MLGTGGLAVHAVFVLHPALTRWAVHRGPTGCRFFAETTGTLLCAFNGRRERCAADGSRQIDYWISDGIYGVHPHTTQGWSSNLK